MNVNTYLFTSTLKTRIKDLIKIFISRPRQVHISVEKLLKGLREARLKTFIQVGSNDGKKNDPIREIVLRNKMRGILIEPLPQNFKKLAENYKNIEGLHLLNIGIAEEPGLFNFYYIKDVSDNEPNWYDQIGSFDRNTFDKSVAGEPGLVERMEVQQIACDTINNVLASNNMEDVDLVHIDAEGFDAKIIRSIDFTSICPKIIIFEKEWMTFFEWKQVESLLRKYGYKIYESGIDVVAVQKSFA
jgi:FkbM family methyltransferase